MRSVELGDFVPPNPIRSQPRRRQVLATLGLVLAATLTGCTQQPAPAGPPPEPDELAVDRAVTSARQLRDNALSLAANNRKLAPLLRQIAAVHAAHLQSLGGTGSGSPSPSSSPSASANGAVLTPAQLLKAELTAAGVALRDGQAAAPVFAVLLGRIAAARAAHADLVSAAIGRRPSGVLTPAPAPTAGPSSPSSTSSAASSALPSTASTSPQSPSPSAWNDLTFPTAAPTVSVTAPDSPGLVAVNRLLAGQHAAVFAYPLIISRIGGKQHRLAGALWQAHREERDRLEAVLLAAGAEPVAAQPAYDVGTVPTNPAKAAALAARVERGLAALAADVIAAAEGAERELGADQLVLAARRTAAWTSKPIAYPGLASAPAATPSPSSTG